MANDIGSSINTHILAQSSVTAICADRGYPENLPQGCLLPAFTYEVISDIPQHHLGGMSGPRMARLQIDSYAATRKQANELDEAILALFASTPRGTFGGTFCNTIQGQERLSGSDQPIDGSDAWRYIAIRDYLIWYVP